MPFDGIVTYHVVHELKNTLAGGKIEKIYQPEKDEIILSIHKDRLKYRLLITSNSTYPRLCLIEDQPPNPPQPPAFCMLLRKHIQGGVILDILQKDTERIVEIWIHTFNEMGYAVTKKLIVEIMNKHSNITLIDGEKQVIFDSIKRISLDVNRYRQLMPGVAYLYPPPQEKSPFLQVNQASFMEILRTSQKKVSASLPSSIMGISTFTANMLCAKAGISADLYCQELTPKQQQQLTDCYMNLVEHLQNNHFEPMVWLDEDGVPIDFYSFPSPDLSQAYQNIAFESISETICYYYSKKDSSNRIRQKSSDLAKILNVALEKAYSKKGKLSEEIQQAQNADAHQIKGELLLANLHLIKQGESKISLLNYYTQENVEIDLDSLLSPSDNAQRYYKKYRKAKTAAKEKQIQLEETEKEILYLESIIQSLEQASEFEDLAEIRQEMIDMGYLKNRAAIKQKNTPATPYSFKTSDGFSVLAGRNNKQNDQLTMKTAKGTDIWFHTKDIPGSHVILLTNGKEPSPAALSETASIAAYFSKGKMSENVPVDYTMVKYVKKPVGAKPGMVIFDHNKTLYVPPTLPEEKTV